MQKRKRNKMELETRANSGGTADLYSDIIGNEMCDTVLSRHMQNILAKTSLHTSLQNRPKNYDENEIAALADAWENSKHIPEDTAPLLAMEASKILSIKNIMKQTKQEQQPVPVFLQSALEKIAAVKGEAKGKQEKPCTIPSLLIELVNDGCLRVKSTLQGFTSLVPEPVMLRSAPAAQSKEGRAIQKSNYAICYARHKGESLRYEVLRDSQNTAMLTVVVPENYLNSRARLYQKKHLIDTQNFDRETRSIIFRRLPIGEYIIRFSGDMEHSNRIILRSRPALV